jgi:hypothetical protein
MRRDNIKKYPMRAHGITTVSKGAKFYRWYMLFYHFVRNYEFQNSYMYNNIKNSFLILRNYLIQGVYHAY